MIITILANVAVGTLGLLMSFLPTVTELPFGIDSAFTLFVGTIRGFVEIMPWFEVVWDLLILAIIIKSLLFAWHWTHTIFTLIRG